MAKRDKTTKPELVQHICYSSPAWGHPLNKQQPLAAYESFLRFLKDCTDWDQTQPGGEVKVTPPGEFMPDGWADATARETLQERFGDSRVRLYIGSVPIPSWQVPPDHHDWMLKFTLSQPAAKRGCPDPVDYILSYEYLLRDPRTGHILPEQRKRTIGELTISSNALVFIASGKVSAAIELRFPMAEPDHDFLDYFKTIRPFLPFRYSRSGFRIWIPKKDQSGYRMQRIDSSIFVEI